MRVCVCVYIGRRFVERFSKYLYKKAWVLSQYLFIAIKCNQPQWYWYGFRQNEFREFHNEFFLSLSLSSFLFSFSFFNISISFFSAADIPKCWDVLQKLNGIPWFILVECKAVIQAYDDNLWARILKNLRPFHSIAMRDVDWACTMYAQFSEVYHFRIASLLAFQMHTSQTDMFMWCYFCGSAYI